jgi:hypothetical protein
MNARRLGQTWWPILLGAMAASSAEADEAPARFYRGLNLNGPALVIDGHPWDGKGAKDYSCNGASFENQGVSLRPQTDPERTRMIRSSRWGRSIDVELKNVPAGLYQVFLYVWEDTDATTFAVSLNERGVVPRYDSRGAGFWKKLGPWPVNVTAGTIKLSATGGDANLSGIEVWSGPGPIPGSESGDMVAAPTPEQAQFFEGKIRPLLVKHCYQCHSEGAKKLGGNLLLDSRAGMVRGGDTEPPVVPGDPAASLLMEAVRYTDPALRMPPKAKLSEAEIADLESWVKMGAPDPRKGGAAPEKPKYSIDWEKARQFWSFRPVRSPQPPAVRDASWPVNEIDRFILERLEREGLAPLGDADRPALLRRASYDLTGLPPSPEEIAAFVSDPSPDAFATVVDRLLASPQYGERWGRHWLDVVRYSDTAGDNSDFPIPQMYKYRNWVISAFNRDLPYDRFVREQLAGDLMPAGDGARGHEQVIATGYLANARRFGSRVSDYPQHLTIEDTIDNLGRTFLGLTINCARCHDHKFDPIGTEDYYALYGIFQSTRYPWPGIELEQSQRDLVPLVSAAEAEAAVKAKRERQEQLQAEVRRLEEERKSAKGEAVAGAEKAVKDAKKAAEDHSRTPLPFEQAYAVAEAAKIEDAWVQTKGDPNKLGTQVHRRFPTILGGHPLPSEDRSSGRSRLAEWIIDPSNPLTARVMVNRIWLHHFGRGIVPTPNDFGRQGRPPSHPELLDWLASRFVESGWSIKALHRRIMLSRTYRLASRHDASASPSPAGAELLGEYPRRRLDAEAIRDTLLALGGNLDASAGGPHPFPPQTEWRFTQHNPFKAVYDTDRRSVYLMTQRIQRHPYLAIFDGADPAASTPVRPASTTPLQALYLLNDPFVHEQSRRFAGRLLAERPDDASRLDRAYLLALGRAPDPEEAGMGLAFLKAVREELTSAGIPADQVGPQAWHSFARTLFRLNEFVYID